MEIPERLWIWPPLINEMGGGALTECECDGYVSYIIGTPENLAARDLLEALKELLSACDEDFGIPGEHDGDDEAVGASLECEMALKFGHLRRARAAIAKAEGKTMISDIIHHLSGKYDGWRVEKYGTKVIIIDHTGLVRDVVVYQTQDEAREAVLTLTDVVYAGRWK